MKANAWQQTKLDQRACSAKTTIAMKLTPELLAQAPSALNPSKERQLDLRGEQYIQFFEALLQFAQRL